MANNPEDKDDYDVGYGKPPKDTQFKKGQSGNPNGRPKNTKNFKTDLKEELSELVQVTEGGVSRSMSKQRALVKSAINRAISGNDRAAEMVGKWNAQHLDTEEGTDSPRTLSDEDREILERYTTQQKASDDTSGDKS